MKIVNSVLIHINQPISSEKIAVFRVLFGTVLFLQAWYFSVIDFIQKDLIESILHFPYPYLEFIEVQDPFIMKAILFLMFISSLSLMLGFRARLSSLIYLLTFSYLWLIDKGFYNNHYYLISLLLLLMCFIRSDISLSISKKSTNANNHLWEEYILIFQFSLVLIFAGFNKINEWWLIYHEPVHHILMYKAVISKNALWGSELLELFMIWGGLLFDLFIVPLLLWRRTRWFGFLLFVFFNGMNTLLFYDVGEIGIFPLLMLSALILFFPRLEVRQLLVRKFSYMPSNNDLKSNKGQLSTITGVLLIGYILIQLILPLRHHLYEGNVDYTGEGQRFSWRMKSVYKDFEISIRLVDEERGIEANLDPRTVLSVKQYTNLGYYPELIIPLSENLRRSAIEKGVKDPKIYIDYKVGFMGLPLQYMVDPTIELASLCYSPFKHSSWILPLKRE